MSRIPKSVRPWLQFACLVLSVAVLYAARPVLVPIALALLITFTLAPMASRLERRIGPAAAVCVVVVLAFSVLGGIAWVFTMQLGSLASELPSYRENIRDKIADIRFASRGGSLEQVQETVEEIQEEIARDESASAKPPPVPVVQTDDRGGLSAIRSTLGPVVSALASAGFIVVLVVFMLLEREEIRNRVVRLLGAGRLGVVRQAMDEAGARISRYLLRHTIVNGTFGVAVGIGLYLLGVPYALMWGSLAAVLRFVPYVGPWIGAIAPVLMSLAVFPGWTRSLYVGLLFLVAELFTNMVMETLLYAGAAGVSKVGLLVAIAFWTWLWGPLGLLMATPLTVCLVVLGKHMPSMSFLNTLLGSDAPHDADVTYYHAVLAGDRDEASELLEQRLARSDAPAVLDALVVPALCYARQDVASGRLAPKDEVDVARESARVVDDVLAGRGITPPENGSADEPITVLGCPANGESDAFALHLFAQILDPAAFHVEIASASLLSSETVELVREREGVVVCIASLPPGGLKHARYLCKRLRAAYPDTKILVGRWGPAGLGGEGAEQLLEDGADAVGATLAESREQLEQIATPARPPDTHSVTGAA